MAVGTSSDSSAVPPAVRVASEWAWRLAVLAIAGLLLLKAVATLSVVVIPVLIALLAAALLNPLVNWITRRGLPRWLAVITSLLLALGAVAGIVTFVVDRLITGLPELTSQVAESIKEVQTWLADGPLHVRQDQIANVTNQLIEQLQKHQDAITSGALTTAATAGEIMTGVLLVVFTLIFFLHGGREIWLFICRLVPGQARTKVIAAGSAGFTSLVGYVRATVVVAAVDGIFIGVGLAIIGVPLAVPLGSLVFVGAFIPIIGALVTGAAAVLVALVAKGPIYALIALGIVVAVMQIEAHVLQPLLLGRAVALHPLAVVLAIAAGLTLDGIIGALLAVPIVAFANSAVRVLVRQPDDPLSEKRGADWERADQEHQEIEELTDPPLAEPPPTK